MNKEITFTFDEPIPEELVGKTFEEFFKIVKEKNHDVIEKMKLLSGDTIYTPEIEKQLTEDERMYLRLAQWLKEMRD